MFTINTNSGGSSWTPSDIDLIQDIFNNKTKMIKLVKSPAFVNKILNTGIYYDLVSNFDTYNLFLEKDLIRFIINKTDLNIDDYETIVQLIADDNAIDKIGESSDALYKLFGSNIAIFELNKSSNQQKILKLLRKSSSLNISTYPTIQSIANSKSAKLKLIQSKVGAYIATKMSALGSIFPGINSSNRLGWFQYNNGTYMVGVFTQNTNWNNAKSLAQSLGSGWRLAEMNNRSSKLSNELGYIYTFKNSIIPGMDTNKWYWSATEYSSSISWILTFSTGDEGYDNKSTSNGVLAVCKL